MTQKKQQKTYINQRNGVNHSRNPPPPPTYVKPTPTPAPPTTKQS